VVQGMFLIFVGYDHDHVSVNREVNRNTFLGVPLFVYFDVSVFSFF
jgi:hypothetical protein